MSDERKRTPQFAPDDATDHTERVPGVSPDASDSVDLNEPAEEGLWTSAPELDTVPTARTDLDTVPMAHAAPEDEVSLELNTEERKVEADLLEHVFDLEAHLATIKDAHGKVDLLLEIGSFWQGQLRDQESAIAAYERVLELEHQNPTAFHALEQLYGETGHHAELVTLLIGAAEQTDSVTDRTQHLQQLAALYQDIGEPEKSAMVLEAALEGTPDRSSLVVRLHQLEETASPELPEDAASGAATPDEDHYEDLRLDPFELLVQRLAEPIDDDERVEVCQQLSKLALSDRDDEEAAIGYLRQALRINPATDTLYDELERIFEDQRSLEDLATLLREEAETSHPGAQVLIYKRLAHLCENRLEDQAAALLAYQQASHASPEDTDLLAKQIELATPLQDWIATLDALTALTRLPHDEADQAQLLHRIGGLYQYQLDNREEAQRFYVEALEVYPAHAATIARLSKMYRQDRRWEELADLLERAERYSTGAQQRTDLLVEAARVSVEHLEDDTRAAKSLAAAHQLDAERHDAIVLLAELLWRQSRHEEAAPLLQRMLDFDTSTAGLPERHTLRLRLAAIEDARGDLAAALEHAREAHSANPHRDDPQGLPTLLLLAELAHRAEQWEDAHRANLQLIEHKGQLDDEVSTAAHRRLAHAAQQVSDQNTALASLRWLVANDPDNTDSLTTLCELYQGREDWPALARSKQALILKTSGATRIDLWLDLAELQWKRLDQPNLAAEAYQSILTEQPDHRSALHGLLDVASELEHWPIAVDLCSRLATLEADPQLQAKYHYTAALIARDKLSDSETALAMFNRTLDADPQDVRAFRDIDALCTQLQDWKALERNYAKMLKRLPDKGFRRLKARLWQNLAEVLRTHTLDPEGAAAALEAALAQEPENMDVRIVLAHIYSDLGQDFLDKTIESHLALLQRDPTLLDAFRVLRRAYIAQQHYDPVWCLSGTLVFLQQANKEEHDFHRQYRVRTLLRVKARLTDQMWAQLRHPAQDLDLSALFALVSPAIASATARSPGEFGFKRKDRADPQDQSDRLAETFRYVTAALSVVTADLHIQPDEPVALSFAHTTGTPSFVAGKHVLKLDSRRAMAFALARQLTFLRHEYSLRFALGSPTGLHLAVQAAFQLVDHAPPLGGQNNRRQIRRLTTHCRDHLQQSQLERLAPLVARLSKIQAVDVDRWWTATELTADRAALLLCNDIELAARMIGVDSATTAVPADERIKQLVQFACSPEYFSLREALGLTIDQLASKGESRGR